MRYKKKLKFHLQCDKCGVLFYPGDTNGLPNGIKAVMDNGKEITLCQSCICELGEADEETKKHFFDELIGDE